MIYIHNMNYFGRIMAKMIVCPNCGDIFKRPAMDIKFSHLGWTIPGTGLVRCPSCKEEKRRKFFKLATDQEIQEHESNPQPVNKMPQEQARDEIEDSKFEE